jgi:hypothetical protein
MMMIAGPRPRPLPGPCPPAVPARLLQASFASSYPCPAPAPAPVHLPQVIDARLVAALRHSDRDQSGDVSYAEFLAACKRLARRHMHSMHGALAADMSIVRNVLRLTGGLHGLGLAVGAHLDSYSGFAHLWTNSVKGEVSGFLQSNPAADIIVEHLRRCVCVCVCDARLTRPLALALVN